MSKNAVMPMEDYVATCDKIRRTLKTPIEVDVIVSNKAIYPTEKEFTEILTVGTLNIGEQYSISYTDTTMAKENAGGSYSVKDINVQGENMIGFGATMAHPDGENYTFNLYVYQDGGNIMLYVSDTAAHISGKAVYITLEKHTGKIVSGELAEKVDEVYKEGQIVGQETEHASFWKSYLNSKDLPNAFAGGGWNAHTFRPTKAIVPENATQMFNGHNTAMPIYDFAEHCEKYNIVIDLTQCGYAPNLFSKANISRVGKIDLQKPASTYAFSALFQNSKVETIDEFVFYETHPEYDGSMFRATNLKNFKATGTIAKNGLDFHWCPDLTEESLDSILKCLKGFQETTENHTIIFGDTNLAKIPNVKKQLAQQKGWTLL